MVTKVFLYAGYFGMLIIVNLRATNNMYFNNRNTLFPLIFFLS